MTAMTRPLLMQSWTTLMNIRDGQQPGCGEPHYLSKSTVVEVLQVCGDGWLRIRCPESELVLPMEGRRQVYLWSWEKGLLRYLPGNNLWKISEEQIGDGTRYTEIRELKRPDLQRDPELGCNWCFHDHVQKFFMEHHSHGMLRHLLFSRKGERR